MASMRGRRGVGQSSSTLQVAYEDFQPVADWTNDSNSHVLLVDLPGFKKEEVKLEVVNNGIVTVRGERQLSENKYKRFKQDYSLPIDSDIEKISGKFDGGLLFVIIPKIEFEIEEEPKEQHYIAKRIADELKQKISKTEATIIAKKPKKDEKEKFGFAESATEMIISNKGMVLAAVLGFTVGMYLSYKLR
ncbi:hypothetical protein NE237_005768 [Protea cynaroides]|uniref:SHSP domain-containing protein n=1 Tax=Protea cynaroides TaxID=273540 RepID=A0A9Q0KLU5_9MAGN|nr:hypothetical protein NE237_005768 [Protea cynaroides]